MVMREIINVDEEKCTGCGECIPNCPEGALQIIDGKARLVSDLFCDGLGACVGHCPVDAMTLEDDIAVVDEQWCIGCGVCATVCPSDALKLKIRPDKKEVQPAKSFWELHEKILTEKGGKS